MLSSFSDLTFSAAEDQVNSVSSFNYLGEMEMEDACMSIAF